MAEAAILGDILGQAIASALTSLFEKLGAGLPKPFDDGGRFPKPLDDGVCFPKPFDLIERLSESHKREMDAFKDRMAKELQRAKATEKEARQAMRSMEETMRVKEQELKKEMMEREKRANETITALKGAFEEQEKRSQEIVSQLRREINRPIEERKKKLDFVNSLHLKIFQTDQLLLLGAKGTGKSTFLWLLGLGEKPERAFNDGTTKIKRVQGFLDTIGLRGITPEELLKLLVVLIYHGIPHDIILFGNDRIVSPIVQLASVGITAPMIVILSGTFWRDHNRGKIRLVKDAVSGVLKVEPVQDLDMVFDLEAYEQIKEFHLGMPITHVDDIGAIVEKRQTTGGINPFGPLIDMLGKEFTASLKMENNVQEMIFRFVYIFEKKYQKDTLKFLNGASLKEYDDL